MKRLLFIILLLGVARFAGAQTSENLFEWQDGNAIVPKEKFLGLNPGWSIGNVPLYTYKEYEVYSDNQNIYQVKIRGAGNEEMSKYGGYDFFEIYCGDKQILRCIPHDILCDVRYITVKQSKDYFIKVPLSADSFALFFGGWLFGSGDTATEMVVVVVSGDKAKVVFDDYAYAYKYTPGENFAIEYVDDIDGLHAIGSAGFTEAYLKSRTKYKIWKEGNMLKYKSWK